MLNMHSAPAQTLGNFMHLFGGGDEDAAGYLSQIPGEIGEHFAPYKRMLDPTALMSEFGKGYHQSPGYQFALDQALKAGGRASAAGGMAGSPMQQEQAGQMTTGLAMISIALLKLTLLVLGVMVVLAKTLLAVL